MTILLYLHLLPRIPSKITQIFNLRIAFLEKKKLIQMTTVKFLSNMIFTSTQDFSILCEAIQTMKISFLTA